MGPWLEMRMRPQFQFVPLEGLNQVILLSNFYTQYHHRSFLGRGLSNEAHLDFMLKKVKARLYWLLTKMLFYL